jgi:3-phosphoshikimate 1-carboxyvinyltransferase
MSHTPADAAVIVPARCVTGRVRVPGDKSMSHRYAMLAALAEGVSTIDNYLEGQDCAATLECLRALGVTVQHVGRGVRIQGRGLSGLTPPAAPLDAGNSGTTMRLLAGIVSAHAFRTVIGGDASLTRRPMLRVIDPLSLMGASIASHDGCPPLTIDGAALRGIQHEPRIPSAQVKGAVLLAGLQADGDTIVVEPHATRDHTERALAAFGARVHRENGRVRLAGKQRLRGRDLAVPGDVSSAAFWMALGAGTPGGNLEIDDVGLNPTRTAVLDIIRRSGADVESEVQREEAGEPVGRIHVRFGLPRSFSVEPEEVPGVIDEIPALAALAALLPPGAVLQVRGAAELRVKESDRIACLARGFRALGAEVDEYPDGFRLESRPLAGSTVDAAGDHRLAMAFAIAATRAAQPTTILGAASAAVSYPGFYAELARLTR